MQNLKSFILATHWQITLIALAACFVVPATTAMGQGSDSIWSPRYDGEAVPQGKCFFRKKFTLTNPDQAEILIVAEDSFELYINGRTVLTGNREGEVYEANVSDFLKPGVNLVAFRAENFDEQAPGLACKLRVKEMNETRWRSLQTDSNWKTRITEIPNWNSLGYNDIGWLDARTIVSEHLSTDDQGDPIVKNMKAQATSEINPELIGVPKPQLIILDSKKNVPTRTQVADLADSKTDAAENTDKSTSDSLEIIDNGRFELDPEFRIEQVMLDSQTGSVIAIAFDEFGRLIFSQEGGPLMVATLSAPLNDPNRIRVLCDKVTSCQGILPLNGDVYVTGDGPNGVGLYCLEKIGDSAKLSIKKTLVRFKGEIGEHGPHGIQLGNDGMIYCIVGNGSGIDQPTAGTSPFQNEYDGDLVERYEDPGGHAVGIRGQGGTVIRLTLDGSKIETVAGGIRNAYDLAFDSWGDLFIHDSDMEADMGTGWYRPTSITHVVAGAELGWRSGWAKFPEYFADTIPPAAKTGRGSPTGAVLYQHVQFPARFHDALFFADWSEGRILAAFPRENGATKSVETEVFATGKPMNVTDLAVGQDGSLYFSTGGRGTNGGLYRIFWGGSVPETVTNFENNLAQVIRQPQPNSAWARQNIALIQRDMAATWKEDITGVAKETRNPAEYRTRALDIMVVYGPFPSTEFLEEMANDESERVRSKVAAICGLRPQFQSVLERLIDDTSANVRRQVCESYLRLGVEPDADTLLGLLNKEDRFQTVAARRLLERIPVGIWMDKVISSPNKQVFVNGSLAALSAEPSLELSYGILARASQLMDDFVSDSDFIDILRVVQLALVTGKVDPNRVPAFADRIKSEFPSGNGTLNRELARAMAYLKTGSLDNRLQSYLESSSDNQEDKVHVAMYLQTVGSQLAGPERIALIDFLEQARSQPGGGSYKLYLSNALTDLAKTLTTDQLETVLENGGRWPTVLIETYYKLPTQLDESLVRKLIRLDGQLKNKADTEKARLGVIALLGRNSDSASMAYLRQLWEQETDRRSDIAIGLAQQPNGENWPYLVSSLPVLDDKTSIEVMQRLTEVNLRPKTAQFYLEVLQKGYQMENEGAEKAAQLIQHWSGKEETTPGENWQERLDYWQDWYVDKFPTGPAIQMLETEIASVYTTAQILDYMNDNGPGDPERGHSLFTKVQCASCHRYGANGDSTGPDLTSLARRYSRREMVEAVLEPSKVVPSQYKSKSILTKNGLQFDGLVVQDNGTYTVVQSDGKKVVVAETEVEAIKDREESSMPSGLLDNLSLEEINDLFAYMYSSQPDRFADAATAAGARLGSSRANTKQDVVPRTSDGAIVPNDALRWR